MNKRPLSLDEQIALLKQRGMLFYDEANAYERLSKISYYRLKGYWWDIQSDVVLHNFKSGTYFEDIMARYDFDRKLRLILFGGIEQIEIALRTKMVYHLSMAYGGLWYQYTDIFESGLRTINGSTKTTHLHTLDDLQKEYDRSQEIFIKEQQRRYPNQSVDAWIIMEIASMGTLSKLYKSLKPNVPERGRIANELGINSPAIFSGWLEAIVYLRNIIAHHSRLWSRTLVKRPSMHLKNPAGAWFTQPLKQGQLDKPFSTISCMVYLCGFLNYTNIKLEIINLIQEFSNVPTYKLGFFNHWKNEPLWAC